MIAVPAILRSTSHGLNRFDTERAEFTRYTTKDGLPNDVIYGALPDDQGNVWVSTNKGLSGFDPRVGQFRNYDLQDGLQSREFNSGLSSKVRLARTVAHMARK